jgi:hypothetical protein
MKVRLKDSIISELTVIGLKPGMVVKSTQVNKTTGAVDFIHYYNFSPYNCVVWPEDYEIVEEQETQVEKPVFPEIPQEITLSIPELTNALDAMHWVFVPYLDNPDLSELPWITNLIEAYNGIARSLPSPWDLQYEPIDF